MNHFKKEEITNALFEYCERYDSQRRAANSLKDVSATTIGNILKRAWDQVSDIMWRNVAVQIGVKPIDWEMVEISDHILLKSMFDDARENALVLAITGSAGSGKTFTIRHYTNTNKGVYTLSCNEYWNRKFFLCELMTVLGRDYKGMSVPEMMREVVFALKTSQYKPLLILDEADKLSDQVLYFFITLYNQLEDECGIILIATNHLEKKLKRGVERNKMGYNEIWSRIGRKCIQMRGLTKADIVAVCEANKVTDPEEITSIIKDCDGDLRRVKRRVHALTHTKRVHIGEVAISSGE